MWPAIARKASPNLARAHELGLGVKQSDKLGPDLVRAGGMER